MADPAVEAALRAEPDDLIGAAREALKPIREKHRPVKQYAHPDSGLDCLECRRCWPCDTALDVYTTEELR